MAINNVVRAALRAISYRDIDVKKNYKEYRKLVNLAHGNRKKHLRTALDFEINSGGYTIPLRVYCPEKPGEYPAVLFFHGGGWVTGNIDSYDKVCSNIARHIGCKIISVDYRLAPEHHFPAALNDCYEAAKTLISNGIIRNDKLTVMGDSAGGNLAAALSLMSRDRKEFKIEKQILIYPSTYNDHGENSPFASVKENGTEYLLTSKRINDYMDMYKGSSEDFNNPYLAPLLAEDFSGQPKTLIITAEYCPLRDEGEEYGRKLRDAGNYVEIYRIKDGLHGFFTLPPVFPQVKLCYEIINRFLCEVN
jgi:acetyl esterase/lipase